MSHPPALESRAYYRRDIDGLRGVAVGLVILYHLFPRLFKNGFLGVDVFFVISGFVVTQALKRDLHQGIFNGLVRFYARRIKRILPALYANIAVTMTLSCLLIPPSDLRSIFKTAASAVVGASNIALLYARFDYFSPDLALNPFVQTWSLGVEEQFYLLFPSLLIFGSYLAARSRRFKPAGLLAALAASSLLYWADRQFHAPVSAFYNPLARFWELLIGAVMALNMEALAGLVRGKIGVCLQYLAVILLALALSLAPDQAPLYYFSNFLVVASAALVLATGMASSRHANGVLGSNFLVWIGKLSYSLYLWHHCVFTFARWNSDLERPEVALAALLLTVGVSYLSYRFIEVPFRYASE